MLTKTRRRLKKPAETQLAVNMLSVLLDSPRGDPDELDWSALRTVAERGGVMVRVADVIRARGDTLPPRFAEAAARACARTPRVLELIDRIGSRCGLLGIPHAFLKTTERYPDAGRDVLLLVDAPPSADRAILQYVPAAPRPRGLRQRLAGTSTYVAAYGITIEIRHSRLGQLGEHARYARQLLQRARSVTVGGVTCLAPAAEDHLLLLAAHQVFSRPALRLSDLCWALTTLRDPVEPLDWDAVFATAQSMGLVPAVGAYLQYVDSVHARVFGTPLVADDLLARFAARHRVAPDRGSVRFPLPRSRARLYLKQVRATLKSRRWHSAVRLSMLPLVAALVTGTRRSS
jgi:hypothetical protein